jgi:hypothetical protein
MQIRGNAGLASVFSGEADAAREAFREELELCRELVVPPIAHEALRGLAAVAVIDGDIGRAARLVGAATLTDSATPRTPWTRGSARASSIPSAEVPIALLGMPRSMKAPH